MGSTSKRRIAERDYRDGRDKARTQAVHGVPFSQASQFTRHASHTCGAYYRGWPD